LGVALLRHELILLRVRRAGVGVATRLWWPLAYEPRYSLRTSFNRVETPKKGSAGIKQRIDEETAYGALNSLYTLLKSEWYDEQATVHIMFFD
jgi:hypothetical protein